MLYYGDGDPQDDILHCMVMIALQIALILVYTLLHVINRYKLLT